jgi:hypothetical protein
VSAIFVSYRRADSGGVAGRLFDRLAEHFGADQVFRDIDSIEAGENFEERIRDGLRLATVVLIVIGPRWLEARSEDGARRIDDPADYVRREIEMALSSDAAVVPLLVEGARLPAPESMPEPVRALTLRNNWELSDRRWDSDTRDLIAHLEQGLGIPPGDSGGTPSTSLNAVALQALVGFPPNLFYLLTGPRRFLARHARGRASDLLAAIIFLLLALLLGDIVLTTIYTPRESLLGLIVASVVVMVLMTLAISAPLWFAWRLMGARRHYARLLVVLLHQVSIVQLVPLVVGAVIATGVELRSMNSVRLAMDDAMKQGSASAALEALAESLEPLYQGPEVLIATGLGLVVTLAGAIWVIRSWGAYRDAFDLSRGRSVGALLLFVLTCWAGVALLGWLASPAI